MSIQIAFTRAGFRLPAIYVADIRNVRRCPVIFGAHFH